MTKKEQLIKIIYDCIMKYGSISTRPNELYTQTTERIDNKIYVRKLPVSNLRIKDVSVRMLSVASDNISFTHTSLADVRIGCENPNKIWSNVFAKECDDEFLMSIITAI